MTTTRTGIIGAVVFLIISLVTAFVIPIVRFQPWYQWWSKHQPTSGVKMSCVPLALLAYRASASILYDIASLVVSENNQLTQSWQADFIMYVMERWAVDVAPADTACVTPASMCLSIAPQPGEPGHDTPPRVVAGKAGSYTGPDFTAWPDDIVQDPRYANYGIEILWKAVLASWGVTPGDPVKGPLVNGGWNKEPSNFLNMRYKIPYDSDLIGSFLTGSRTAPDGHILYPEALPTLLGFNPAAGAMGWIGLLRISGNWGGMGIAELQSQVWASDLAKVPQAASPIKKSAGSCIASAASQGVSMGTMGAFLGIAIAGGPVGWLAAGGAALFGLTGGIIGAAENNWCS